MTTPNDPNPLDAFGQRLAAYADGELTEQQCQELLREAEALPDIPDTSRCTEHQRQLRKLLAGCMDCKKTMRCPDELKRCIEGIAKDCEDDADEHTGAGGSDHAGRNEAAVPLAFAGPTSSSSASAWRWGIAAALLFALIGGMYALTSQRSDDPQFAEGPRAAQPPASAGLSLASFADRRLEGIVNRHVRCAAGQSTPGNPDAYATDPAKLATQVADTLDCPPLPVELNLHNAGLNLRLAGRCSAPGPNAMHLIYDAQPNAGDGATAATVSLWIKAYHADADPLCTPGQLEVLADDGQPHPVMLWRDDQYMYVLVGDAMPQVQRAQRTITASAI